MALMYIRSQTINKVNEVYYKSLGDFLGILASDPKFFLGKKTQEELYQEFIIDGIINKRNLLESKNKLNKTIQENRKKKYKLNKSKTLKNQCIAYISKDGINIHRCSLETVEEEDYCHVHIDSTLPYGEVSLSEE